jgi:hypothetical protein
MDTPTLFDQPTMAAHDHARIAKQRERVMWLMRDGYWRTLAEIEAATGYPQASISARLRDFRKARFGSHTVLRRRAAEGGGTWEYRLEVKP